MKFSNIHVYGYAKDKDFMLAGENLKHVGITVRNFTLQVVSHRTLSDLREAHTLSDQSCCWPGGRYSVVSSSMHMNHKERHNSIVIFFAASLTLLLEIFFNHVNLIHKFSNRKSKFYMCKEIQPSMIAVDIFPCLWLNPCLLATVTNSHIFLLYPLRHNFTLLFNLLN